MGEFNKEKIRTELLAPNGIFSITTCPYVPAHNGVVERHWRTVTDATICQLLASNLSESYWEESARCASYIINRITSAHSETHPTSPYEEYFGIAPPIRHFRIFGSVCYVKDMLSPKQPRAKSFRGIFVGYEDRQHVGYRVYLPEHKSFTVSFHVDFSSADDIFKEHQNKSLSDEQVELLMKSLTQPSTPHTNPPTSIPLPTSSPVNENETLDTTRQKEVPLRRSPRLQKTTPPNTSDLHLVALEDIQTLLTPVSYTHLTLRRRG